MYGKAKGDIESMIMKDVLKVIYSPVKAFESIVKKPDIKGPFIILALIMICAAIEQYAFASRIFLTDRDPKNDEWTEPSSLHLWKSNGSLSAVNVTFAGDPLRDDHCMRSEVSNEATIWMNITNIGSFNCSGEEGYKSLSFWLNWTNHLGNSPNSSSTLRLFSTDKSQYFEYNLTDLISKPAWGWSIPVSGVSLNSQVWVSVNSPIWGNITGLEFMLKWSEKANLTMSINGLYFLKKPFSYLTTQSFGSDTISSMVLGTLIGFFLLWIAYTGSFYVISWVSRQKIGSFRSLFLTLGHAFAVGTVGILVRAIMYLSLPALGLPFGSWAQATDADSVNAGLMVESYWYPNLAYSLIPIASIVLDIWIVALCAISIRALGGLSWKRAAVYAAVAYFIKMFLFSYYSLI